MAEIWGLAAIVLMEVVLSVDNLLFLSLIGLHLPSDKQKRLWRLWLLWSPLLRVGLLILLLTFLQTDKVIFTYQGLSLTWRGLLLSAGGIFLMYKAVREIFRHVEPVQKKLHTASVFSTVLIQAFLVDFVFSIDSVLTAVGLARSLWAATVAVVLSILLMVWAGQKIQAFIQRHKSFQVLGLAFLMLIGFTLFVEGIHIELPRGYVYFAIFFAFGVEYLQIWIEDREKKQAGAGS